MVDAAKATGIAMRVAVFFFCCVGIALIIFGCVLENPPKGYAPGMFVAAGSLNLFASMAGLWGSYNKKRILLIFIIFGGISVVLQIAFVITLHTSFDSVVDAIKKNSGPEKQDNLVKQLNAMRWVALAFIFIELLTLILACILKWVIKEDNAYHGFDDDQQEQRALAMGNLRSDLEANANKNVKSYDRIKEKMAIKYGSLGQATGDWKQKVKISFGNGRG